MIEIRFDKTKNEVALLIWFLVDHSVFSPLLPYRTVIWGIEDYGKSNNLLFTA
jgi:hypothetical protein